MKTSVAAIAIATAFALGGFAIESANASSVQVAGSATMQNGAPYSFADLIEEVSPAVVSINTETEIENPLANPDFDPEDLPPGFREFFERFQQRNPEAEPRRGRGAGSGFFISADGLVVTNNHVVDDATSITVRTPDGEEYDAEIVGVDAPTDLAVLRIEGGGFPFVAFNEGAPPRVGDWVVAVGNPFGLGGTATAGIVSASEREINAQYNGFIQIDAPINQGNSGGPLFDLNGNVVGVNSQIFSPTGGNIGIGFAIPADTAMRTVTAIIEDGRVARGWLGVTIQSIDDDAALALGLDNSEGALVTSIVAGGPAALGGIEAGDAVLSLNGESVESSVELTRRIGGLRAGERARFGILRDGRRRTVTVTLGDRPSEERLAELSNPDSEGVATLEPDNSDTEIMGLSLSSLDQSSRDRLNLRGGNSGVLVQDVDQDSDAFEKGLRPGMAILEVGNQSVSDAAEFQRLIDDARASGREAVLLLVQVPQGRQYVAVPLEGDG